MASTHARMSVFRERATAVTQEHQPSPESSTPIAKAKDDVAAANDAAVTDANDAASKVTWSRRRLLKELAKANGAMAGLLVLPAAWSKPLMEFGAVGMIGGLSGSPSNNSPSPTPTPSPLPCMTGKLILSLASSLPVADAQFNVYYWGADKAGGGNDIQAEYNNALKTFSLLTMSSSLAKMTQTTLGTLSGGTLTLPLNAITGTFSVSFAMTAPGRSFTSPAQENVTLDFTLTQGANASLAIGNPKSPHC